MNNIFLYNNVLTRAKEIFLAQSQKYGNSFVEVSSLTLTHLAGSRAYRVKTLLTQNSKTGAVGETIDHSLYGIVNYSIINLILLQFKNGSWGDRFDVEDILWRYNETVKDLKKLFLAKTKDYNGQWKTMPAIVLIEIILMKLRRINALDRQKASPTSIVFELQDIINYTIFAIILVE